MEEVGTGKDVLGESEAGAEHIEGQPDPAVEFWTLSWKGRSASTLLVLANDMLADSAQRSMWSRCRRSTVSPADCMLSGLSKDGDESCR